MKVFLSVPMRGRSDEDIESEMRYLAAYTKNQFPKESIEFIDNFLKYYPKESTDKNIPLKFLAISINKLSEADVAVFSKNWTYYRGCRIEHLCAVSYGIKIVEVPK